MAWLNGHSSDVQYITTVAPAVDAGAGSPGQPSTGTTTGTGTNVIDGTPVRVVVLALAAAGGLFALKAAGLRFNVGVSA